MEYALSYHIYLVEALLGVVVLNMVLAYSFRGNPFKFIKYSRIGFFSFWGFWAMTVFSGLIVFMFTHQNLVASIYVMIIASIMLPIMDGRRALKLRDAWVEKDVGYKISLRCLSAEAVVIVAVTLFAIFYK